jgi:hypothetical protein
VESSAETKVQTLVFAQNPNTVLSTLTASLSTQTQHPLNMSI